MRVVLELQSSSSQYVSVPVGERKRQLAGRGRALLGKLLSVSIVSIFTGPKVVLEISRIFDYR